MIDFGKMDVEGFASIQNETFDWDQPGLNIIQAPNGFGKTKFINALFWVLYGKSLSGSIETWSHLRTSSYKGVKVSIGFSVDNLDYHLTRYKSYSKMKNALILEEDGEPSDITDKIELQKYVEDLLGYTPDLFKASIIFGQKLKRIIAETGPNKKKVFDEAFKVTYIPRAKKIAEVKLTGHRLDLTKKELEEEKVNGKINGKESAIASEEQLINGFEEKKAKKVRGIRLLLKGKKDELKVLEKLHGDIDENVRIAEHEVEIFEKDLASPKEILKWERELATKKGDKTRAERDAESVHIEIQKLKGLTGSIPLICSNCGKAYTKSERKEEESRLYTELSKQNKLYQKFIDSIGNTKGQIKELKGNISSAQVVQEEYDTCMERLNALEATQETIQNTRKEVNKHKKDRDEARGEKLENNLEQLTLELTEFQMQHKAMQKELKQIRKDVEAYEWVIKTPLSNSGLKAFIFNQMLDTINDRLQFYSKYINFQVAFFIDMQSANKNLETYVFIGEDPVPYDDLSGGQQQSVDIASAFAIHDVVSDSKLCSLLAMDELFESLDKDNIEIMTEIIQDKSKDKSLFIVTHRAEFNPTNANIINIDFTDGVTSLA